MNVRLRLSNVGVRNSPYYRIVATPGRTARDRNQLELLGTYNPVPDKSGIKHIQLNFDRIKYWIGVGAIPSDRVAFLLAKAGIIPKKPVPVVKERVETEGKGKGRKKDA